MVQLEITKGADMADIRKTEFYINMTPYHACECAEGFGSGDGASRDEQIAAWQFIYDHRMHRFLHGFYGRTIQALFNQGLINTQEN